MLMYTVFAIMAGFVAAQDIPIPGIINCPAGDTACLVRNAQYTVLGTVTNTFTNASGATPSRYNATLKVDCVWTSFSSPPSSGEGLAGSSLLVANWGKPKPQCPNGGGADAPLNVTQIYFLNVAVKPKAGVQPKDMIYSVQAICVGGVDASQSTAVASVMAGYPKNVISPSSQGNDAMCKLVIPSNVGSAPGQSTITFTQPDSNSGADTMRALSFVAFVIACVALSL
ncbi:hypothetical protein BC833DRAFT_595311 [Globomyces pollinis-pini]|nr:hypothetical protein BC833DRAFT_595311 [Globomyces pollinis-pini]